MRIHTTLIHPEGTQFCQVLSASQWPNPALQNNNPFARFTPTLDVTAPPTPACSDSPTGTSWGTAGPPTELVEVPLSMQATTEGANLKWQVLSRYATQLNCTPSPEYHVNCGYMRAFVKKHEFFWTRHYSPLKQWPRPYLAHWTSAESASQLAQIFEGQWVYDGQGIRPAATGFDRVITLGDTSWLDYEASAEMTFNSFDTSHPTVGSAVARARLAGPLRLGSAALRPSLGWLCLYAYNGVDRVALPPPDPATARGRPTTRSSPRRTSTCRSASSTPCGSASATSATA